MSGDSSEGSRSDDGAAGVDSVAVDDLRIAADLDLAVDGHSVRVRSTDGRIEVFADGIDALERIGSLPAALPGRVGDALERVPVGVHVDGVEVARVDPGVPPGPLSRLLGCAPARVDLVGLARAWLRGRR